MSVCPIDRPQQWHEMGLLLGARQTGDIDRQRPAPAAAAPQHGTALTNVGSVAFTAAVKG